MSSLHHTHCGEIMELEGTASSDTLPNISQHQKGIYEKQQFWLKERRKRVTE